MTITAEEASTKFLAILDQITDGEPVTITRQGVPVARILPAGESSELSAARQAASAVAVDRILELRERQPAINHEEFLDILAEAKKH